MCNSLLIVHIHPVSVALIMLLMSSNQSYLVYDEVTSRLESKMGSVKSSPLCLKTPFIGFIYQRPTWAIINSKKSDSATFAPGPALYDPYNVGLCI